MTDYVVTKNTVIAVKEQSAQLTAVDGYSTDGYFVQTLADGTEISFSKDKVERNVFTSHLGKVTPRVTEVSVSGTIPVEWKAHGTEGSAPEYGLLIQSVLGAKRNAVTVTSKSSGTNTSSKCYIADADIAKFKVGDIVMIKTASSYHISPITVVDTTTDNCYITLLVADNTTIANSSPIAAFTTYYTADSGHPFFTVDRVEESTKLTEAIGCRANSLSLENFSVGQIPTLSIGFEGIDFDQREISTLSATRTFNSALPPIALNACVYMDGSQLETTEFAFSVENGIGNVKSTCSSSGKLSSRIVDRTVSGSFTVNAVKGDVSFFTKYDANTEFAIFAHAWLPTSTAGQYEDAVAVYLPKCTITEMSQGDADGITTLTISFDATRGADGTHEEVYMSFI